MPISTAVVLAAGEGRRLRPLTRNRPKPMLPAGHRPILEYVFDSLIDAGISRLYVVVGYRGDRVKSYFGPTYRDITLEYVTQEKQLGSGHAVLAAREALLKDDHSDPFLVVNGDQLYATEMISDLIDHHRSPDGTVSIGVLRSERAKEYGVVRMEGKSVVEIIERPRTNDHHLLNAGIYAVDSSIFADIEATPRREGELSLPDVLNRKIEVGDPIFGVMTEGMWEDATYPWDLLRLSRTILAANEIEFSRSTDNEDIWIASSANVHERAILRPPVVVGPDTEIGPLAIIGPHTALGRNVTVDAGATVDRSTLDNDTRVGVSSILIDCVTGQGVRIGPGTTVSGGKADVRVGDRIFEDRSLGGVFADRARLGGSVTVIPGTLVGSNTHVHSGVTLEGVIVADAEVLR